MFSDGRTDGLGLLRFVFHDMPSRVRQSLVLRHFFPAGGGGNVLVACPAACLTLTGIRLMVGQDLISSDLTIGL
jgi:hypothetical protein